MNLPAISVRSTHVATGSILPVQGVRDTDRNVRVSGPAPRGGTTSAFTLVELLVAASVSIILLTFLLSTLQGISANYLRTQGSVTRQGNSAFALDQMVQDLDSLVVPHFAGAEALRLTPETVAEASNTAWLTLLATTTDEDNSASPNNFNGATRAISYRLAHQNSLDGSAMDPSYALYRTVASSLVTFTDAIYQADAQTAFWSWNLPTKRDALLSEHVVAFSVRFLRADDNTWTSPGSVIRIGRDGTTVDGAVVVGGFKRAEVTITVLSPEGAQRVAGGMPLSQAIPRYGRTSVRQTSHF